MLPASVHRTVPNTFECIMVLKSLSPTRIVGMSTPGSRKGWGILGFFIVSWMGRFPWNLLPSEVQAVQTWRFKMQAVHKPRHSCTKLHCIKTAIFWDVTHHVLVNIYRHFDWRSMNMCKVTRPLLPEDGSFRSQLRISYVFVVRSILVTWNPMFNKKRAVSSDLCVFYI
jgi:hypothetical protein